MEEEEEEKRRKKREKGFLGLSFRTYPQILIGESKTHHKGPIS
jgi:hypothetical protein